MLDKMLGQDGKVVVNRQRRQEWAWEAKQSLEGNERVFKPLSSKVHIKFGEEDG